MSEEKSELRSALESNKKKKRLGWIIGAVVVVVALVAGGIAIANAVGGGDEDEPVRIAIAEEAIYWDVIAEVAAEDGVTIEWVNLNDWVLPNTQLVDGEVDGNAFQHLLYLSNFNNENDADLVPVASTIVVQWGIFSSSLGSLDDLEDGATVAIPNDASNGGRALRILESAGLIEISEDAGDVPSEDDITANERNLEFQPLEATTIPQQFDDPSLDAVVVGTSYFDPSQEITVDDALYADDALNEQTLPYVNVLATTPENADSPEWETIGAAYQDQRVKDAVLEDTFDSTVVVDVPRTELQEQLDSLEEQTASQS